MAAYTITTNAAEESVIAWFLPRVNAQRAVDGKPAVTAAQLLDYFVREQLLAAAAQFKDDEDRSVSAAFGTATAAKRQQVKAALGVS